MRNNRKLYSVALASAVVILVLIIVSSTASASTLNVGSTAKYKTIQSAVNAAKPGDTIKVAYGTYKENVKLDKDVTILGTKYPKVDGFYYYGGGSTINGFSIQKYGVSSNFAGGGLIRNNYFYNCGVSLAGSTCSGSVIMNNQIKGGSIFLYDIMATGEPVIKGNTISNSRCGLYIKESGIPAVNSNTFKNCKTAVYFQGWESNPGRLSTFTGNKYINNKVNIGWGMKELS